MVKKKLTMGDVLEHMGAPRPTVLTGSISFVQRAVHELARKKGWWPILEKKGLTAKQRQQQLEAMVPEKLVLVHSEISEAMEEYRSRKMLSEVTFGEENDAGEDKPEGFAVELADAVIRIFDLAEALNIDLGYWIMRKHEYNSGRSRRHGGKKA